MPYNNATMKLYLHHMASPLGPLLVATDAQQHVRALDFEEDETRMEDLLIQQYGQHQLVPKDASATLDTCIRQYFAGEVEALDQLLVKTSGSAFQEQVWELLRTIPAGQTTTYGDIARQLGLPGHARQVGAAVASNPVALLVPCHRVIGSNGDLTGFAWGLSRKQWLLSHEKYHA